MNMVPWRTNGNIGNQSLSEDDSSGALEVDCSSQDITFVAILLLHILEILGWFRTPKQYNISTMTQLINMGWFAQQNTGKSTDESFVSNVVALKQPFEI